VRTAPAAAREREPAVTSGSPFRFVYGVLLFADKITWMALAGMF